MAVSCCSALPLSTSRAQVAFELALQKMRAIKRSKTRDKREQAHREALRAMQHSADTAKEGPRSAAGRIPGAFAGESITKSHQVSSDDD